MTLEEFKVLLSSLPDSQSHPFLNAESMNININISVDIRPINAYTGNGDIDLQVAQTTSPGTVEQNRAERPDKGGESMLESIDMGAVVDAVKAAAVAGATKEAAAGAQEMAGAAVKSTVATGQKVLGWLKEKLVGFPAQGLEHACEKPEEAGRWKTFGVQLEGLVEEEPEFASEFAAFLKEVLPEAVGDSITQEALVENSNNVNITQIGPGSGNQVSQA